MTGEDADPPTDAVRAALAFLVGGLPPDGQEAVRRRIVEMVRDDFRERGAREPDWIAELIDV